MVSMRMSILVVLGLALGVTGATITSCGTGGGTTGTTGDGGETQGAGGGGGEGGAGVCASSDFEAQVIEFCKTQNPPAPGPGEMGASCVDGSQCTSQYCLEPFGNPAYCTILCPAGNECPIGYSCQDTGVDGPACYQDVCIYGGTDAADCTKNLLAELDTACTMSECELGRIQGWMDCIVGAGRLCGPEDAADKCGIERGLLEDCCNACDSLDW